jgi:phosphotransferase system HPr (HPr) family protein
VNITGSASRPDAQLLDGLLHAVRAGRGSVMVVRGEAGALAVAAGRFASAVSVTADGRTADAKSVLGVMGLGATSGQHVTVSAAGPDAGEAVAALITVLGEATRVGG